MTQTIYGMIADGGDGSASMRWFRQKPNVEHMEDKNPEIWSISEGISEILTFPDTLDLEKCGFHFTTLEEIYMCKENL